MPKQNSRVSKNYSCLFCSNPADPIKPEFVDDRGDPINWDDEDVKAKVLKALCNHLMPQNQDDIPEQFTPEMFPFCTSCKDLVTELWECQEVVRKTQLRLTEITTIIEKKVVEGVILDGQMPSSAATSEKRFIKLRDVILNHYRETLIIKRKEKLTSIPLVTSSPVSVISEVKTAKASCSVIISSPSSTKCNTDVNDATGNECAEPAFGTLLSTTQRDALPGVSISAIESNQKISQSLFENDSLFEEEHHVIKSESQSESEMEVEDHPNEDTESGSECEAKDQQSVNQVVTCASPPGPSKPLRKTRKRMSNPRKSTLSLMAVERKGRIPNVAGTRGMFEGTEYKILENKRIKCGCCNHIFSFLSSFKRHVRKESHQCNVCKMIFTQACHLKSHHYKFHGAGVNETFPCPHCGYQYNQRCNLNRHLRNKCKGRDQR